jgi:hypothetical protein
MELFVRAIFFIQALYSLDTGQANTGYVRHALTSCSMSSFDVDHGLLNFPPLLEHILTSSHSFFLVLISHTYAWHAHASVCSALVRAKATLVHPFRLQIPLPPRVDTPHK